MDSDLNESLTLSISAYQIIILQKFQDPIKKKAKFHFFFLEMMVVGAFFFFFFQ